MSTEEVFERIFEILGKKARALDNMGQQETANGVKIAASEITVLCMTEFNIDLVKKKPG